MKKPKTKLTLSPQTIRQITSTDAPDSALRQVGGGGNVSVLHCNIFFTRVQGACD